MKSAKSPVHFPIIAAAAAVGIGLSVKLTHQYYELRGGAGSFRSFCNYSASMNCDIVAASPYAELVAGIPLSSFASGWFLGLALLALMGMLMDDWRKAAARALLLLSGAGLAISGFYLLVMASVLKTFCLFCLLIDGVSAVIFVLALLAHRTVKGAFAEGQLKTVAGVLAGSLFVAIVLSKSMDSAVMDSSTLKLRVDSVLATQPVAVASGPEFPSLGPADAPVTIVEFSDFQCPYCRIGALTLNAVMNRYPAKVRVVFRNFPLDPSCNPLVQHSMHPAACESARTALCAQKQGKFKEVYESLFEHQSKLAPGKPLELAREAGANTDQLSACASQTDVNAAVSRDIDEGKRLGVQSTPTFFINGRKVEGGIPAQAWYEIIERLLAQ